MWIKTAKKERTILGSKKLTPYKLSTGTCYKKLNTEPERKDRNMGKQELNREKFWDSLLRKLHKFLVFSSSRLCHSLQDRCRWTTATLQGLSFRSRLLAMTILFVASRVRSRHTLKTSRFYSYREKVQTKK